MEGVRIGVHVCRGNWSRNEDVLLSGDYTALAPCFGEMTVDQLVLEYSTPRAGDIGVVGKVLYDKEIGLGVVNPRTSRAESAAEIVEQVEAVLEYYRPEQIFLNPDCGFGTFANRPINDEATAAAKIQQIVHAARVLREKYA